MHPQSSDSTSPEELGGLQFLSMRQTSLRAAIAYLPLRVPTSRPQTPPTQARIKIPSGQKDSIPQWRAFVSSLD
jgi:hypothetical protein